MAKNTGVNAGGTSLLSIFVLLCLATFGALSLSSANADYRLVERSAQSVSAYYEADSQAVSCYARLDKAMREARGATMEEYQQEMYLWVVAQSTYPPEVSLIDGRMVCSFQVPIDENRSIYVAVEATEPRKPRLIQWKTILTGEWEIDDGINLWDGGDLTVLSE